MVALEERIKILEKCELFRRLPPEALAAAAARCEEGAAQEGEVLLVEGKPADAVYVLADGKVDYIKHVDEKRGLVISRWEAGAVFGLPFRGFPRSASLIRALPLRKRPPVLESRPDCSYNAASHRMI